MAELEDILKEAQEAKIAARMLVVKLYGENGFEGDITEIKRRLIRIDKIEERSKINRYLILGILAAVAGGGGVGLTKLIQVLAQVGG